MQRRTILRLVPLVPGAMLPGMRPAEAAAPLAAWRWRARVLLVFAPNAADPGLVGQRRELAAAMPGTGERDLVAIEVIADRVTAVAGDASPDGAALRARYTVPAGQFLVVLIGKDGGEKLRRTQPISAAALFAVIDRMPMRRDEMARR